MILRGCVFNLAFVCLLAVAFGGSSYFWFKFWVRGKSIPTPNLIGKTLTESRAVCSDLGLVVVVDNRKDRHGDNVPAGSVVWQNRAPESLIKRGTRIHVGQSLGPLVLRVPELTGKSARTAMLQLNQRNLRIGAISYFQHGQTQNAAAAEPAFGEVVGEQTSVSVAIALPPPPRAFVMPDLINRRLDDVKFRLENYGFLLSNVKMESYPGVDDGTIIRQYPLPGGKVRKGEPISLVVATQEIPFD
ncbi:MAG: PASTA domain-containing protein [Thermoanaerobaculia bacterium]|nr:PASTA domain-containing protein [Thermoanaerobaculia bacterium]